MPPKSPIRKEHAIPPKSPIGKTRRPSTEGLPSSPAEVRLVGVPLTRSKSERARLLALATDALVPDVQLTRSKSVSAMPDAGAPAGGDAEMGGDGAGGGGGAGGNPFVSLGAPAIPLVRSAASELALMVSSEMHI